MVGNLKNAHQSFFKGTCNFRLEVTNSRLILKSGLEVRIWTFKVLWHYTFFRFFTGPTLPLEINQTGGQDSHLFRFLNAEAKFTLTVGIFRVNILKIVIGLF